MKRKTSVVEDCQACGLRQKSVVCDLAGDDLAEFQRGKHSFHYDANQPVFYEGHTCLGLYLLCSGKVKLTRSSARGQRQIVRILDGGQLIEKHAFKDGALHETTCETIEPSQISLIEKEAYLRLIQHNPQLAVKLIQLLSCELGAHIDQLDQFTFKTARERLAGLLLELGNRFGGKTEDGIRVGPTLKREEVAEMAGITVETAVRLLGTFRDEGLIRLDGRTITLLNPDRLTRLARL